MVLLAASEAKRLFFFRTPFFSSQVVAEVVGAEADKTAVLCFRAEVLLPSVHSARCIDVSVSLRRGRRRDQRADSNLYGGETGIAAMLAEEVWFVGSGSVPVPSFLSW